MDVLDHGRGRDVSDIALSDVRISGKGGGDDALVSRPVPEREREYPDAARFRNLPAHGLYCRHVTGLRLERAAFTVAEPDARPALVLDDVRDASIRSPGAETLVRLSGAETARVHVVAPAAVLLDSDVEATALRTEGRVRRLRAG